MLVCICANVHVCVGAFCLRALHMYSHAHGNSKLTSISWESWESLGIWIISTTLMYVFLDSPTFWGPLATNLGVGWLFYILIPCLTLASWLCQGSCYIDCFLCPSFHYISSILFSNRKTKWASGLQEAVQDVPVELLFSYLHPYHPNLLTCPINQ